MRDHQYAALARFDRGIEAWIDVSSAVAADVERAGPRERLVEQCIGKPFDVAHDVAPAFGHDASGASRPDAFQILERRGARNSTRQREIKATATA